MENADSASQKRRVVKLLLLYQGRKAEKFLEQIITPLEKHSIGDIECRCDKLDFGETHGQVVLHDEYTKKAAWADAAIAILAKDRRAASLVGNVWLEIGWWLAKKPYGTLQICVQNHRKVATVSNFEGRKAPRFSGHSDLLEAIREHVAFVASIRSLSREVWGRRYDQNGNYLDTSKLKDTLGCDKWDHHGVYTCEHLILRPGNESSQGVTGQRTLECDFRRQSTGFISELMRMARASRECIEIQDAFHNFAVSASNALATDKQAIDKYNQSCDENRRDELRHKHLNDMFSSLCQLANSVKELILPRRRFYNPDAKDEWEKLRYFIIYRLETVCEHYTDMTIPQDLCLAIQAMIPKVEPFTDWARKLVQCGISENAYYKQPRGDSEDSTKEADQLYEYRRLAKTMAELLGYISYEYFRSCRQSMKSFLCDSESNPFADLRYTLSNLRSNLPHNKEDCVFPRIWPEKREKG